MQRMQDVLCRWAANLEPLYAAPDLQDVPVCAPQVGTLMGISWNLQAVAGSGIRLHAVQLSKEEQPVGHCVCP